MRIVAGRWRGHTIKAPADDRVRPTADRVREAWMSIVHPQLPGARVVDLFAGSGALGLEALSRGASHCDFVEIAARSRAALRANIDKLGAGDVAHIIRADALKFVERLEPDAYDIAFADSCSGVTSVSEARVSAAARVTTRWLSTPSSARASSTRSP